MTLLTPLAYYQQKCSAGSIVQDEQQLIALEAIQSLFSQLLVTHQRRHSLLRWFYKNKSPQGLYLWGGVGIGKTFLMDCFYYCLPFKEKMRIHFHPFMQLIHQTLRHHQGEKNPLDKVANDIAKKYDVLCFDEMHVTDITDAMLLARLLKALFERGVCLVATSNALPDDLYKGGLQRSLFLPAIELIKTYCHILHLTTQQDYRLRHFKQAGVFYAPNDAAAKRNMQKSFELLTHGQTLKIEKTLEIHHRLIAVRQMTDEIIWFDFNAICSSPRSQHDFIAISQLFKIVFISDIPIIQPHEKDKIALFIRLIDVFYDARTKLVFSAETSIENIYPAGNLLTDFIRTKSRLLEMQSEYYFNLNI